MFDWWEYLALAQRLEAAGDEASRRSAISRAYYSVLCAARNSLVNSQSGFVVNPGRSLHAQVWDAYERRGDLAGRQIAQWGRRLKHHRARADYHDNMPGLLKTVQDSMHTARRLRGSI